MPSNARVARDAGTFRSLPLLKAKEIGKPKRDGERYCIRKVNKQRLMNARNGGAGAPPNDKSVGGVFLLVGIKWP